MVGNASAATFPCDSAHVKHSLLACLGVFGRAHVTWPSQCASIAFLPLGSLNSARLGGGRGGQTWGRTGLGDRAGPPGPRCRNYSQTVNLLYGEMSSRQSKGPPNQNLEKQVLHFKVDCVFLWACRFSQSRPNLALLGFLCYRSAWLVARIPKTMAWSPSPIGPASRGCPATPTSSQSLRRRFGSIAHCSIFPLVTGILQVPPWVRRQQRIHANSGAVRVARVRRRQRIHANTWAVRAARRLQRHTRAVRAKRRLQRNSRPARRGRRS